MRKFILAAAFLAMSAVSAEAGGELDQSKPLLLRPGIDDLGVSVERFVHYARKMPQEREGTTMLVNIEGRSIIVRNSATPEKGVHFELNPIGEAAYMVAQVCVVGGVHDGRCWTRFKDKQQMARLFLTALAMENLARAQAADKRRNECHRELKARAQGKYFRAEYDTARDRCDQIQ